MNPAAVLSILVKAQGATAAAGQLASVDAAGRKAAASSKELEKATIRSSKGYDTLSTAAKVGGLAVAGGAALALKAAGDFESSLNTLQSVSGATGKEMSKISGLAKQLGADVKLPGTSAQDAAEAMTEMSKAGLSLGDTMSGVRSVLVLSAAAGVDNARAAEIASNALNTFKLKGKDVAMVADQLANTANASSVEINDVADAMKQAGAVFSAFQGPVRGAKGAMTDLNVAVGLLGNAGIKGSDAGTSLKAAMLALSGPADKTKNLMRDLYLATDGSTKAQELFRRSVEGSTKEIRDNASSALEKLQGSSKGAGDIAYTASGKMRSLSEILSQVTRATKDMTQEQRQSAITQIFGADATRSILALMQAGPAAWDKMSAAVTKQGAAQDLAASKMKGFKGSMEAFKSTLETLAISFGSILLPAATKTMAFLSGQFGKFEQHKTAVLALVAALAALSVTVLAVNAAVKVWAAMQTVAMVATKAWAAAQWLLNAAMTANPIALLVIGLIALGAALVLAYKKSETFRNIVNATWSAIKGTTMAVLDWLVPAVKKAWSVVADVVGVAVKIVRGYVSAYASAAKAIVDAIIAAFNFLKALPGKVSGFFSDTTRKIREWITNFASAALDIGKAIGSGILDGLGDLGHLILEKAKDALGFVAKNIPLTPAGAVGKAIGSLVGDGVGRTAGTALPSGAGMAGGSLMGAKSIMSPFASMAGRFGLRTSSGLRPGAITSSGNPSFHGTGNAIDESGSPAGMLGYFKYLKSNFGSRLRELIYTPGGVGIKDGKPFRYTGQVAADHFDHVHVAFTGGAGDGIGRVARTGDGIGDIRALWTRAGGSASAQNLAAAVAMAESGGNPAITNRNSDGSIDRGLWQINSVHGSLSTLDRLGNARAAVKISSNGRNWNPWVAFKNGAYKRFLSSASSGSGSAPGKGKATGTTQGGKLPKITPAFYDTPEISEQVTAAQDFLDRKGRAGVGPVKGGGPSKGISQELADARSNAPAQDPYADLAGFSSDIRRRIAQSALTDDKADDIAAAGSAEWLAQVKYDRALASGDNDRIAEAAEGLKTARDTLKALTENTAAVTDLAAAMKDVQGAIDRQTEFAKGVTATSNFQLTKNLADLLGAQIVGYGVAGRAFTPGTGVEHAY